MTDSRNSPLETIGASPIPSALAASSPLTSRLELYVFEKTTCVVKLK
jgi:hypothetical protein